jgi:2,4-dienoyl-CoA reductase-like NADH-dependent reductase (Old Yellow Enzyme family)
MNSPVPVKATVSNQNTMMKSQPSSKLFTPLKIANGKIELKHRVILAPLTRNRCVPLEKSTPEAPNRYWFPDELVVEYYRQRTTDGGLLISEGIAPSLQASQSL